MEKANVKIGATCKVKDDEDGQWYEATVISLDPLKLEDTDPKSPWQGMKFDMSDSEINDKTYVRWN